MITVFDYFDQYSTATSVRDFFSYIFFLVSAADVREQEAAAGGGVQDVVRAAERHAATGVDPSAGGLSRDVFCSIHRSIKATLLRLSGDLLVFVYFLISFTEPQRTSLAKATVAWN
jgi:hypothetical protein